MWLAVLAAIGMLVIVFLPQFSPSTTLPGSKGTLMATLGLVAVASAVITLLQWLSVIGLLFSSFGTIMLIVAIAGTAVMAWAGWQELQGEGGQWKFGMDGPTKASPAATTEATPPAPPAAAPPPPPATTSEASYEAPAATPPPAPAPPPPAAEPIADDEDLDRPRDA